MNAITVSTNESPSGLGIWFARIHGKIDELRAAIFAKSGIFVFKTHTYSVDELLEHPILESIRAMCGQVDSIVGSWEASGNVDAATVKLYNGNRIETEQRLSRLRAEIVARKPTFWEALLQTLEHLARKALKLLPILPALMLERFGIPVAAIQRHLASRSVELDDLIDSLVRK